MGVALTTITLVDKDDKDKDSVQALFDKAKRSGAVQGTSDDLQQPSGAFAGSGRTIAGSSAQASRPQAAGPVTYVITFYRNNVFTGECPEELEPPVRGTPITVNLVRSEQEYKEPEKPKYTAFVGSGRTLGNSGPSASSEAGPSSSAAASAAEGEWEGVNEAQPTTSLQLRLADGARLVGGPLAAKES
ncbi:uncharacterized protein HaLaN_02163 [Haematococcus lacustris]|uniref:SEP domain-containing protein n=1 Tax=Haematococcus lacustris TaxID=44745 RepID=A0A699YDC6_HAELA|nr:uncharacterized protein HaLaN_02163 [Haematococcus lacustris]